MDSDPYLGVDVYVEASRVVHRDWRMWVPLGLLTTAAVMLCVVAGSFLSIWIDGLLPAVFGVVWCWCTGLSVAAALDSEQADSGQRRLRRTLTQLPWRRVAALSTVMAALTTLGVHLWLLPAVAVLVLGWYGPTLVVLPGATVAQTLLASVKLAWDDPLDLLVLVAVATVVTVISVGTCTTVLPLTFPVLALATSAATRRISSRSTP